MPLLLTPRSPTAGALSVSTAPRLLAGTIHSSPRPAREPRGPGRGLATDAYARSRAGGNARIGLVLGTFVASVFFYTMYQVKKLADVGLGEEFNQKKGDAKPSAS